MIKIIDMERYKVCVYIVVLYQYSTAGTGCMRIRITSMRPLAPPPAGAELQWWLRARCQLVLLRGGVVAVAGARLPTERLLVWDVF
jgi:hypothetical protein